ncbi:toll-like receptor 4 [Saccostrea echinata]|uniref:toll-like receptor 4 n=1 Tax=Saccostrea echinata TaxID=191078 RepID=UPI002A809FEB|nr:toll-like receptor 4 [Saccostrea echinata]
MLIYIELILSASICTTVCHNLLGSGKCSIKYNSTDVIVTCSSLTEPPKSIPKNVTILHYINCKGNILCHEKGYEKLRVIDLSKNKMDNIQEGCFSAFPSLENLSISNNDELGLHNLYNACYGLNKTKIKHIYSNNFNQVGVTYPFPRNISLLLQNTFLQTFHLEYNEIRTAESGAIYYMPRTLQDVSVRGNRLETNPIFLEMTNLTRLRKLDISFQCSTRKYRSRSRRRVHFQPYFENQTNYIDCNKDMVESNVLRLLPSSLQKLIATGLGSGSFCIPRLNTRKQSMLEYIDISRAGYYTWLGPFNANQSNNIRTLILSHNQCSEIKEGFFDSLKNLTYLDISFNFLGPFFKRTESGNVFWGLDSLKILLMSYNRISDVEKKLLEHNIELEELNISNNALENWTLDISHLRRLKFIDCSFNKLTTLPKTVRDSLDETSQNHSVTLDFHHNKILCSCENLDFINWLFTSSVNVRLATTDQCTMYNGNLTQAHQHLNEECSKGRDKREWLYPVQFLSILFILSVLVVIVYKKRWAIIYRWYLFRLRRKGYTPIGGCEEGYKYDVFLSFADEDRVFVDKVVEQLEKNADIQFNVCVHYRDFTPGKSISKNIVSAVHTSKKTIVFMSRAYLKSHWCNYELRMAVTEESHMNRKVIIMTVLEEIPKAELSLEVLHYYKKNSYIAKPNNEHEMKLFWKTLKGVVAND